MKRPIANA